MINENEQSEYYELYIYQKYNQLFDTPKKEKKRRYTLWVKSTLDKL